MLGGIRTLLPVSVQVFDDNYSYDKCGKWLLRSALGSKKDSKARLI